jgi:hypothetical protein
MPPLGMRLLPPGFPLRQQLSEHPEELAAGGQLALAEDDELLRRDLVARLHLGEVRAVVPDPVGERLLRQSSRTTPAPQLGAELACTILNRIDL